MTSWQLLAGDCIEVMPTLPDASVGAVVTDPPYGIRFMGKAWDGADIDRATRGRRANPSAYHDPASINGGYRSVAAEAGRYDQSGRGNRAFQEWCEGWGRECLRVLKPGGYLVSFGSPRTYHRLAIGLEDAGFEVRDSLHWLFGCLSEDTEILVDGRWEPYHNATAGRLALCYNTGSDSYEWQPIAELLTYAYRDTAYRIQSDSTDQIVSRNHRCLVERGGSYAFQYAETLQQQARVPVLEDLHGLLAALPLPERHTGAAKHCLLKGMRQCRPERETQRDRQPARSAPRHGGVHLRGMWRRILEASRLGQSASRALLFPQLQWQEAGDGLGAAQRQWQGQDAARDRTGRRGEPRVEGRRNRLQEARQLYGRALRALSRRLPLDGAQGWLRDGASVVRGAGYRATAPARRGGPSQGSQAVQQHPQQSATLRQQSRPQTVRASRFTRPDLATVTPIPYEGIIWCVRVPSGAFVARRNGHVFVTGNSGFPKSLNLGDGVGTALKPAHEPIVLARKPLDGTYAANVARWGVGGLDIDGCRVALNGETPPTGSGDRRGGAVYAQDEWTRTQMANGGNETSALGRWPTNLLLAHHPDCMPVGTRQIKSNGHHPSSRGAGGLGTNGHRGQEGLSERHAASETVDAWSCVPGCPVAILDGQSGERKAGGYVSGLQASATGDGGIYGHFDRIENRPYDDSGGASRFYPTFRFEADDFAPFLYVAKAARSEREKGLRALSKATPGARTGRADGSAGLDSPRAGAGRTNAGANVHPTVKPVQLMRWLVRLVTPPGETVLDPFLGSGTTGVAALMEGRRFVGIEREAAYLEIARRRLEATQPGLDLATAD